jgi:predicted nucleic acid-binding protein
MKLPRIYADTSVIGGYFDPEFETDSRRLIEGVKQGRCVLLLSQVVFDELAATPERVRKLLAILPASQIETVEITNEVTNLCQAYITASILTPRWMDDATHVAAATIAKADAIVSWNFKHIVRLDKMTAYNQINQLHGYGVLTIVSPREVYFDEPDTD